jgi:hypothetical protein
MERLNDGRIWWQKKGGGSFMLRGKLIRANDKFRAAPSEIPTAFKDIIIALEDFVDPAAAPDPLLVVKKVNYSLQPRGKSKSQFDVVDGQGKRINEKALTKEVATNLLNDLMG